MVSYLGSTKYKSKHILKVVTTVLFERVQTRVWKSSRNPHAHCAGSQCQTHSRAIQRPKYTTEQITLMKCREYNIEEIV